MRHGMTKIDEIKQYWDDYIIGIDVSDKLPGTDEFFDEIEAYHINKYGSESESNKLIDFARYKDKTILEIGCGWGCNLIQYASAGAIATGIDLSPKTIELAKGYSQYKGIPAKFLVGNAENLDFGDELFDVVISLGVLHHTPDTEQSIREVYRVLKPGGEALIMLYNKYSWYNLLHLLSGTNIEHQEKDPPVIKMYSKKQVLSLFTEFSSVETDISGLPAKTGKRKGFFAALYNSIFVPACRLVPASIMNQFGFHIVIRATK